MGKFKFLIFSAVVFFSFILFPSFAKTLNFNSVQQERWGKIDLLDILKREKNLYQNHFLFKEITQNTTKYFKFQSENISSIFIDKATGKIFTRNRDMELSELDSNSFSDGKNPVIIELQEMPLLSYKLEVEKKLKEKAHDVTIQTEIFTRVKSHEMRLENIQKEIRKELARSGIEVKKSFKYLFNGLTAELTFEEIEKIKNLQHVKKVYPDRKFRILLDDSVGLINATLAWQMNDTTKESILGKGIKIAIVDTGIDYTHPDLGGCFGAGCKVVGGWDVVNNDTDPVDDNGHGTHVAAIAAGNGIIRGVAPEATLLAYKVLDQYGRGYESWIIEGIERAVADGADIISMSLGLSAWYFTDCYDVALSTVVDNAVDSNVTVVVAAGNEGPGSYTIAAPGCAKKVITVGATCKPGQVGVHQYCDTIIAKFSSRGPTLANGTYIEKPDIVAPGVEICAARYKDAYLEYGVPWCLDEQHMSISGTSMSTPHVAGVAALLLQTHPDWKPEDIKNAMKATAINLGFDVNTQGTGFIDAYNATSINFSAIIKPSVLLLNETPTTQIFSLNKTFLIKNLESISRSYNLSVNLSKEEIEVFLNQSSIDLLPGEEKGFNLTININNTKVPSRTWYWGEVIANSSVQIIRVPFRILINDQAIVNEEVKSDTKKCIYQNGIFICPTCENCYYHLYFLDVGIDDPDASLGLMNKTIKIKNLRNDLNLTFNLSASIQQAGIELSFNQSNITVPANSIAEFNFSVKVNNSKVPNGIYYGNITIINVSFQNITIPFWFIKYHILNLTFSEKPWFSLVHDRSKWSTGFLFAPYNYSIVLLDRSGLYDIISEYLERTIVKEGVYVSGLKNIFINITDARYLINYTLLDENGLLLENNIYYNYYSLCGGGSEITHRESGIGYLILHSVFPFMKYFSNVSSNYTHSFNVVCVRDVIYTVGNYTFSISNDINFQNNPAEFKKITYAFYPDPKIQNEFYFWLCGHGITFTCTGKIFSPKTYHNYTVYYTPLIDEVYLNRYEIDIGEAGWFLPMIYIGSPFIFLNKTHLELQTDSYEQILSVFNLTEVERLSVGLSPIFWFGEFNNLDSEIRIFPYKGVWLWLFLDQDYSKFEQINTTYELYNATGHLIKKDVFLSPDGYPFGVFWWSPFYTNITLPEPGKYSLVVERNYTILDINYTAKVNATFNTSKEDKNPPTLTLLNLNLNNTLVDFILDETNLTFNLDPIGGELTNVSAFVDRGYGWEKLNLSKIEFYTAEIPIANITLSNYSFKIEAVDNSSNTLIFSFQVPAAPKIFVSPEEIVDRVVEGGISIKKLFIENNATGLLKFNVTPDYIFNYSMSEVSYSWEDGITGGVNTGISGDDSYASAILPFNFNFYGSNYSKIYISSNGYLSFEDTSPTLSSNVPFPSNESRYKKVIAILWDDLYPPAPGFGGIWIKNATNPNRFIITYNNISHIRSQGSNTSTFQVILYESGEVKFNYKEVGYTDNTTIGLNEGDGVRYNNYPGIPKNQSSLLFTGVPSWLLLSPSSGSVGKDQKLEVKVTIDSTKLKIGNYSANIEIESNDPYNSSISIPIKLEVIPPYCGDGVCNDGETCSSCPQDCGPCPIPPPPPPLPPMYVYEFDLTLPEKIEIFTNESKQFDIIVKNIANGTLTDLQVKVRSEPYCCVIKITPEKIDLLRPKNSTSFLVSIPSEISPGNYKLIFNITSKQIWKEALVQLTVKELPPKGDIFAPLLERLTGLFSLVLEKEKEGYDVKEVRELLKNAKAACDAKDYEKCSSLTKEAEKLLGEIKKPSSPILLIVVIIFIVVGVVATTPILISRREAPAFKPAKDLLERINQIKLEVEKISERGIDVSDILRELELAKHSANLGLRDTTNMHLKNAIKLIEEKLKG